MAMEIRANLLEPFYQSTKSTRAGTQTTLGGHKKSTRTRLRELIVGGPSRPPARPQVGRRKRPAPSFVSARNPLKQVIHYARLGHLYLPRLGTDAEC
ncbi:Hypothetical predicted protein [Olea europaea subsp. europaea]|uniref:Uncharacterized protein n=1 Tax=Olea europaea subsp. europaea TaxID=158383 RepID=A0A8S0TS90_OLEEU|nr:Hypothetical predicted protein [Olea europaea subsp. europaea]